MLRIVEPEILDQLPPGDPRAIHSRRDLRRVNFLMGNARLLAGMLKPAFSTPPRLILELGCGDGATMLGLARRLGWRDVQVQLLDMRPVVSNATLDEFRRMEWQPEVVQADLHDWIRTPSRSDLVLANLFLHHFREEDLRAFFQAFSRSTSAFASCDPRRWRPAFLTSRLLWLIGCNSVTRHDAIASVRAGFRDRELSALWPRNSAFLLTEKPGGHASHLFFAQARM